ncbi:hypothetical protein DFP73DRAFT_613566 [Morchella snyderi]|nr:hypothetical protein DFP73DRAFT_613566 [Morchella snyderi]
MAEKNTNHRSPSLAVQEEVAYYFPHIADEPADIEAQEHRERLVSETPTRHLSSVSHFQPSEYGQPSIPAIDTTFFRFDGFEVDTDPSKLKDWQADDDSDDDQDDSEPESPPQSRGFRAVSENVGQEGEIDYAAIFLSAVYAAGNTAPPHHNAQTLFEPGEEANDGEASGQAHVSFVNNQGYMHADIPQNDTEPGLIVGPAFSRPARIGDQDELANEPFVLGPNAAMLEEQGFESTAAHTAYYGHNLPTRRSRCPDGRFRCRVCTYTNGRLQALQRHVSTRTDNVRYSCPHCGRPFVRQDLMRIHSRKCIHADKYGDPSDDAPGPPRGPRGSDDGDADAEASSDKGFKGKATKRKVGYTGKTNMGVRAVMA